MQDEPETGSAALVNIAPVNLSTGVYIVVCPLPPFCWGDKVDRKEIQVEKVNGLWCRSVKKEGDFRGKRPLQCFILTIYTTADSD